MKILVIDDNPHKMRQIVDFLKHDFAAAEIVERRSYQSGLKAALLEDPQIILLDMTMPTFDVGGRETGGRERRYAGQQILRQLRRKDAKAFIIVVTQFEKFGEGDEQVTLDQLRDGLSREFEERYLGAVYYQAADSKWREELRAMVARVVSITTRGTDA